MPCLASRFVSVSWSPAPSTTSVLLFLLVVDIGVCLYIGYLFHSTLLFQEPNTLEYRNPYINLEKLYSLKNSTTRYQPIASAPRLAVQVNPLYPDRAYDSEHQLYDTGVGMLSPSDRHLKVNAEVRSILTKRYRVSTVRRRTPSPSSAQLILAWRSVLLCYAFRR